MKIIFNNENDFGVNGFGAEIQKTADNEKVLSFPKETPDEFKAFVRLYAGNTAAGLLSVYGFDARNMQSGLKGWDTKDIDFSFIQLVKKLDGHLPANHLKPMDPKSVPKFKFGAMPPRGPKR